MELIKRLLGGARKPDLATAAEVQGRPDSKPLELDSQVATRRELIRVLTRDTQRLAGIPEAWLESQVLLELGRDGQTLVHLRLVVKHWDERLLKYAVAFQRRLRAEIEHFEPDAREWLLSVSWLYQVDDQCPNLELPDPGAWATPVAKTGEHDELQEDLARLFAVRDAHLTEAGTDQTAGAAIPRPATGSDHGSGAPHRKAKP